MPQNYDSAAALVFVQSPNAQLDGAMNEMYGTVLLIEAPLTCSSRRSIGACLPLQVPYSTASTGAWAWSSRFLMPQVTVRQGIRDDHTTASDNPTQQGVKHPVLQRGVCGTRPRRPTPSVPTPENPHQQWGFSLAHWKRTW